MVGIGEKNLFMGFYRNRPFPCFLCFRGKLQLHRQPGKQVMGRKIDKNVGIVWLWDKKQIGLLIVRVSIKNICSCVSLIFLGFARNTFLDFMFRFDLNQ